jgi:methylmalonyl-CoA mutase cobalamin-binding subunit
MAVPTNTIQNVSRVGVREDLSNKIAELFPDDTPFLNAIGTGKCSATKTEWQTDGLAAANPANARIQGDDLANDVRTDTARVSAYTQISTKVVGVSSTVEATNKAGRELRTDMEMRASGNYASVAPAVGVAGQTAGALGWITSNASRGTGGANGGFNAGTGIVAAATNGTQRAYTEALLKTMLQAIWAKGGNPKMVITAGGQKQTAAAFPGLAQQRRETGAKKATIVAGADIYVSDFGEVQFVPSRFCSARDALIVDPEYWEIGTLDPLAVQDLAKTGLSTRKMLSVEWALKCLNEAASGVVADLT